ncbi:hypothetical protein [Cryptosporangium arvum]|uniref:hypothetical protein n=1 Tax=Cryptosporangium arvum TaxID=80871 RepID=UPI0004BAEFDF|nr:hypothetical protein [Cryptosporangium arvum]
MSAETVPTEIKIARLWLAARGLTDVRSTPVLAARLTVRRRSRVIAALVLALFLIAVALVNVAQLPSDAADDELGWGRRVALLGLVALVLGLVLSLSLLDRWVWRVDQRAAAALPRRAAHPVRPDWRTVLGRARAAFLVTTFAAASTLAVANLIVRDSTARYAAIIQVVGLCGLAVGTALQLRHVLTRPVVADDESSLTADFLMRVEDAREIAVPTAVWSLPVVSVFATGLDSWTYAWLAFIVASVVALAVITVLTARAAR